MGIYWCVLLYFSLYLALHCFALPLSSISVKGGERKALSGFISIILLGRTLSHVSTSLKVISCEHFQLFNLVSTKHDIHHQRLFGTVRGDESFLPPFKKNKEAHFVPSDVSNGLFYISSRTDWSVLCLSVLR